MTTTPFPPTGAPEPPEESSGGRQGWIVALVGLLVVAVAVIALLLLNRDDDGSAPVATTTSSAPAPSTPAPGPTESTVAPVAGCAPNDAAAPAGADVVTVIDVDGDDRPDQAWLTGGGTRIFGITTASGATFSATIDSASPVAASAIVQRVQSDQIPIALVDLGREALVYSLAGCAVTPVQNAQGEPYTFDRGFAGAGTGVGCTESDGSLRLAGLNAVEADDQTWTVTRTFVDLDDDGRRATNGDPEQVATGAAADDPVVTTAQEVSCGDLVAGTDAGPVEPQ